MFLIILVNRFIKSTNQEIFCILKVVRIKSETSLPLFIIKYVHYNYHSYFCSCDSTGQEDKWNTFG